MKPRLLIATTIAATLKAFLLPFAWHFRANGWRVDALAHGAPDCRECTAAFDRVWDIEWSRNPLSASNLAAAPGRVRELVRDQGYDVVHVHTPVAGFVCRMALRGLRRSGSPKIIYTAHGFHFYKGGSYLRNAIFRGAEGLAAKWTDYLVVINSMDQNAAVSSGLMAAGRTIYSPGIGIDRASYDPNRVSDAEVAGVRRELGLTPANQLFLMIAEFTRVKRHIDALSAFARLRTRTAHLAFAGDGPERRRLEERAGALGVGKRVHFLGLRADIPALIKTADATMLTSSREGLPRSILESLSLGVPVIGTEARGIRDLLSDGRGLLVPVGDVNAICRAMEWVLANPDEARVMCQIARASVAAYDLKNVIEIHERLYQTAIRGCQFAAASVGEGICN